MNSIIHNLYQAFDQLDAETMVSYYHKNIIFEDPAFGFLKGDRAKKHVANVMFKSEEEEI
ncbi:MAG: hypothetical protein ACI93P_000800 [bacterium]|jgi:hypothetical protein|tara:strand:- start:273 stop:452 length:180 start_codon:yes stop_codon:yes gene_type:complete